MEVASSDGPILEASMVLLNQFVSILQKHHKPRYNAPNAYYFEAPQCIQSFPGFRLSILRLVTVGLSLGLFFRDLE
jgi:hypothetical protein